MVQCVDTFCYPTVQTALCYMPSFWQNTGVWRTDIQSFFTDRRTDRRTDGQTDGIAIASTALAMRALRRAVKSQKFTVLGILIWSLMQNKHWVQEELTNQYWLLLCTRIGPTQYILRHCQMTNLVLDCFVTETLPLAVSSKEQFLDTDGLLHVENIS